MMLLFKWLREPSLRTILDVMVFIITKLFMLLNTILEFLWCYKNPWLFAEMVDKILSRQTKYWSESRIAIFLPRRNRFLLLLILFSCDGHVWIFVQALRVLYSLECFSDFQPALTLSLQHRSVIYLRTIKCQKEVESARIRDEVSNFEVHEIPSADSAYDILSTNS